MSILFFPVKTAQSKLLKICQLATLHMQKKEKLIILVPDQTSFNFVDELLWRFPEESFLPHPNQFLTIEIEVSSEAAFLFNLKPTAFLKKDSFKKSMNLKTTPPQKNSNSPKSATKSTEMLATP